MNGKTIATILMFVTFISWTSICIVSIIILCFNKNSKTKYVKMA